MSVAEWSAWQQLKQVFHKMQVVRRYLKNGKININNAQKQLDALSLLLLEAVASYRKEKL